MFNKESIKESFTVENIFYTSLIGIFYIFGIYSIIKNFQIFFGTPDLDHFVYLLMSISIWGLFAIVYIEKLQYFSNIKPEKDEQFLVKPKMDMEHMIWFFIQFYVLICFFIMYIQWHDKIEAELLEIGVLKTALIFSSFIPFLVDAYKINKTYFALGLTILISTVALIFIGFFDPSCYQVNDAGIREYITDCRK